jgi:glycosyltransferase involved in cell wall biosynthesis
MSTSEAPFRRLGIRALFLIWGARHGSHRSDLMAKFLGMDLKHVYITARQGRCYALFKYPYQFISTLALLARKRYQLVFIQDPPIFAALPVYLYGLVSSTRFVIDAHTPPLLSPIWTWTLPLHRFLSRRAITTIVTNDYLQRLVASWGAHAFVLQDPPIEPRISKPMCLEDGALNVVMVSSASPDEPVREVLKAARDLPEIHFYITGDHARSHQHIIDSAPSNVHFTGYLREDFFPLLDAADVIVDLCVEDYQFLSGANEALWMGKPLITSKGPVLEDYFNRGTIHVDNTATEIRQGLLEMQDRLAEFEADMRSLQVIRRREWWARANRLVALVQREMNLAPLGAQPN